MPTNPSDQVVLELSPTVAAIDIGEQISYTIVLRTNGLFQDESGTTRVDVKSIINYPSDYLDIVDISINQSLVDSTDDYTIDYSDGYPLAKIELNIDTNNADNNIEIAYITFSGVLQHGNESLMFIMGANWQENSDVTVDGISYLDRVQNANITIGTLEVPFEHSTHLFDQPLTFELPHIPGICSYEMYRSATPYFTLDANTSIGTAVPGEQFVDLSSVGNPALNQSYVFRAISCSGVILTSPTYGEFDFALEAGQ